MSNARAGIVYVDIDGVRFDLAGEVKIFPNDIERESLTGPDGVHGYKEMYIAPAIECEFLKNPSQSLKALQNLTNVSVQAECADGTRYVLRNAWSLKPVELDAVEGKYSLRFEGKAMEELST